MSGSAVQFGAGNIGRGFLAQLFTESGLEVVFVDVAEEVVDALDARRSYSIAIVGDKPELVRIENVRAIHARDREGVAQEIARAEILCTAVGAGALQHIAPTIAAGLLLRNRPVNILLCENLHGAASRLRGLIADSLPESARQTVLANTGFVQAVVSRMVPVQTGDRRADDILAVRVEAYKRLPIDAGAVVGKLPELVGVEATSRFDAYVERKLYTHNCAHAVLGYLGQKAGHTYAYEALEDMRICALLNAVLAETSEALIRKHGFDREEQNAHVADLLHRFQNRELGDTCRRLARDPLRKLAPDDRLVGAARLSEGQAVEPTALAWAIVAALRYEDSDDPSACEMHHIIRQLGRDKAIAQICGIDPEEPLAALLREAFENTERIPDWNRR